MRFLAFLFALTLSQSAAALPNLNYTQPVLLRRHPAGWVAAKHVTTAMRRFADSMLKMKYGVWREKRVEGKLVAARVEFHFWPEKGWHRGVTIYVRKR